MITNQPLKMIAFAEIFSKKYAQCSIVRTHTARGHATIYTLGHGLMIGGTKKSPPRFENAAGNGGGVRNGQ